MSELPTPKLAPTAGVTDPGLIAGSLRIVDPDVLALARNPDSIVDSTQRQDALNKARRLTMGEMRLIKTNDAVYYGEVFDRPDQVFLFNGNIRGTLDYANPQPENFNPTEEMEKAVGALDGRCTHVIVETDDGEMLMIRRTTESTSAQKQTFDIASTTKASTFEAPIPLPSEALKDVVAIIGQPLTLGKNEHGKHMKTRGRIVNITTVSMLERGLIDPRHPKLKKPESYSDAATLFTARMEEKRKSEAKVAASETAGEAAVGATVVIESADSDHQTDPSSVTTPHKPELPTTPENPYRRFEVEELTVIRSNIIDSISEGVRRYDSLEVARATKNLMDIQRELETREGGAPKPAHKRGDKDGAVTYITNVTEDVTSELRNRLLQIDGGLDIAMGIKNTIPEKTSDGELDFDNIELITLMTEVGRLNRKITNSEFFVKKNPFAALTNDALKALVDNFKRTIGELRAQGKDPTDYIEKLMLVGKVIKGREE